MPRQSRTKKKEHVPSATTLATVKREIVQQQLTPRRYNRLLNDERCEIVLQHVAAGSSVSAICKDLGLGSGLVYQRAYDDPTGFGARLKAARQVGTMTQVDSMLTIANNDSESVERSKLKIETLKWLAKHHMADVYGDKPLIDARQLHITVNKDDLDLC